MSKDKLLPCPFCKAIPIMEHINFAKVNHSGDCILREVNRLWREGNNHNFKAF